MEIKIKTEVMVAQDAEAQVLRAIAFAVFEDYIHEVSAEDFQTRFGTRGTECLAKYSERRK